jgi:anti-anti-sigma factor
MDQGQFSEDDPILVIGSGEVNGTPLVVAQGDVDLSTAPLLRTALEEACEKSEVGMVGVDMREVPFIDSAGLALLVEIRKRYYERSQIALVIEKGSQPERVLRLGRFDTFLQVVYSPEDIKKAPAVV